MLFLFAAALAASPAETDDRAAIMRSVEQVLEALTKGDKALLDPVLEKEGALYAFDRRDPAKPRTRVLSFDQLRAEVSPNKAKLVERIGTPTLLQRGEIAQVWASYGFAVNGKLSHCGIDNFTMVRRDGKWRMAALSYTVEAVDQCAALAAPKVSE